MTLTRKLTRHCAASGPKRAKRIAKNFDTAPMHQPCTEITSTSTSRPAPSSVSRPGFSNPLASVEPTVSRTGSTVCVTMSVSAMPVSSVGVNSARPPAPAGRRRSGRKLAGPRRCAGCGGRFRARMRGDAASRGQWFRPAARRPCTRDRRRRCGPRGPSGSPAPTSCRRARRWPRDRRRPGRARGRRPGRCGA